MQTIPLCSIVTFKNHHKLLMFHLKKIFDRKRIERGETLINLLFLNFFSKFSEIFPSFCAVLCLVCTLRLCFCCCSNLYYVATQYFQPTEYCLIKKYIMKFKDFSHYKNKNIVLFEHVLSVIFHKRKMNTVFIKAISHSSKFNILLPKVIKYSHKSPIIFLHAILFH